MTWFAVDTDLAKNNKVKALRNALKIGTVWEVIGRLVAFWGWCQENADETGLLKHCTADDIATAFVWADAKQLIHALTANDKDGKAGFLEVSGDEYRVHGWAKMQAPWYKAKKTREYEEQRYQARTQGKPDEIPAGNHAGIPPGNNREFQKDGTPEIPRHNTNNNLNQDLYQRLDEDDDAQRGGARTHEVDVEGVGGYGDEQPQLVEYDRDDADGAELKAQWVESFGSEPTPEQLRSTITFAGLNTMSIVKAAIQDAALRGVYKHRVMFIAEVLGTWSAQGLKTAEEVEDWKNNEALIKNGHRPRPPGTSVLNLGGKPPPKGIHPT